MYFSICVVSSFEGVRFPIMAAQLRLGSCIVPFVVCFGGVVCFSGIGFVGVGFVGVVFVGFVGVDFVGVDLRVSFVVIFVGVGVNLVGVDFV